MREKNPFFIKGYHGPNYFCDRDDETRKLISAIENGRDVTLMAPRRYGKTGLIHNVFAKIGTDFSPVYIDIFQLRDLTAFTREFSSLVVSELATPMEKTGKGLLDFFRSCRPTATPQPDGRVEFSFDVVPRHAESTLKETFAFLESRKTEPVVAIDEFQQVREFPEQGVEALLRSYVQFCHNAHFIFAGSSQHLMEDMFAVPRAPFYQSTQLMTLDVISEKSYCEFARRHFESTRRKFDAEVFSRLYARFDGITWYLQAVLNRVWGNASGLTDDGVVDEAVATLVDEGAHTYSDLLRSQTVAAQSVLLAIAADGTVDEISGRDFILRHRLPPSSTIRSLIGDLENRNLVCRGNYGYRIYDRLFDIWLRQLNVES